MKSGKSLEDWHFRQGHRPCAPSCTVQGPLIAHNSVPGFQAAAPPDQSPGSSASPWNPPKGHKSPRHLGPQSPFSALEPQRDMAPPLDPARPGTAPPRPAPPPPQGPLGAVPSAHAPRLPRLRLSRAELLLLVCALTFERLGRGLVGPAGPAVSSGTCRVREREDECGKAARCVL